MFIDNIDERLPRIALFSTRAIRAGEELTFDYKMQSKCWALNCSGSCGPQQAPGLAGESTGVQMLLNVIC